MKGRRPVRKNRNVVEQTFDGTLKSGKIMHALLTAVLYIYNFYAIIALYIESLNIGSVHIFNSDSDQQACLNWCRK